MWHELWYIILKTGFVVCLLCCSVDDFCIRDEINDENRTVKIKYCSLKTGGLSLQEVFRKWLVIRQAIHITLSEYNASWLKLKTFKTHWRTRTKNKQTVIDSSISTCLKGRQTHPYPPPPLPPNIRLQQYTYCYYFLMYRWLNRNML